MLHAFLHGASDNAGDTILNVKWASVWSYSSAKLMFLEEE